MFTRGSAPHGSRSSNDCARPGRRGPRQRVEHARTRVAYVVGIGERQRLLTEEVDGGREAVVPELCGSGHGLRRVRPADELPGHAVDAAARDAAQPRVRRRAPRAPRRAGAHDTGCVVGERRTRRDDRARRAGDVHAGKTSTNRNRPVLKCGRLVVHASIRALRSNASRNRSPIVGRAATRIWRARSSTSSRRAPCHGRLRSLAGARSCRLTPGLVRGRGVPSRGWPPRGRRRPRTACR